MNDQDEIYNILALEESVPGLIQAVNEEGTFSSDFGDVLESIIDQLILNAQQKRELEAYLARQRAEVSIASVNAAQKAESSKTWQVALGVGGFVLGVIAFFRNNRK